MTEKDATRPPTDATGADGSTGNGVDGHPAEAGPGPSAEPGEVERLRAEVADLKDRWLRERADVENIKRRAAREKSDALRFGSEGLLKELIPVIDNLHRAVEHARTSRDVDPIVTGVEMVLKGFEDVLERHGVRIVQAKGTPFDPNRHEAVSHVESEAPANTVIEEHQRGYTLHDRLLRPAMVTVGKGPRSGDVAKPGSDD
jgi:molecular chaperone GrpE